MLLSTQLLLDRELSHVMRDIFLTLLNILGADHFNVAIDIAGKSLTHTQSYTVSSTGAPNIDFQCTSYSYTADNNCTA